MTQLSIHKSRHYARLHEQLYIFYSTSLTSDDRQGSGQIGLCKTFCFIIIHL
uniref:Uncharacterized protein n=1 Tax=Arundo donax TaxID=35708 RepID=A0A0A9TR39_ARUDO